MYGLYLFLFVISLAALIIALARPSAFGRALAGVVNYPRFSFGFLVLLFMVLCAFNAPKTTTLQTVNAKATLTNAADSRSKSSVTTKTETTELPVPFTSSTVLDDTLTKGTTQVKVQGVNGVEAQTYKVTYTDGRETGRILISTVVTTPPVNEVIAQGTYVAPAPVQTPTQSCYPLTNDGNCYEPGEYCRNSDRGTSGVAGDGKSIICLDNNG